MNKNLKDYTSQELLTEIEKRQKTEKIWFWIDQQNCYLATGFFCDVSERIKIGDIFLTRDYVFNQIIKKLREKADQRQKDLDRIFQEINDMEFVIELAKRVRDKPTIKLRTGPQQKNISVSGKNKNMKIITVLPIEKKEKDSDV